MESEGVEGRILDSEDEDEDSNDNEEQVEAVLGGLLVVDNAIGASPKTVC